MKMYIVLIRGINVGGKNLVPMKALVTLLQSHQYEQVSHYIQSGNLVLNSTRHPALHIQSLIVEHFNVSAMVLAFDKPLFLSLTNDNPYQTFEGKYVHSYFCENTILVNEEKLNQLMTATEKYTIKDNVFYLYAPEGIGRSKLVTNIDKCLGQPSTGRNLNTVNRLRQMIENN